MYQHVEIQDKNSQTRVQGLKLSDGEEISAVESSANKGDVILTSVPLHSLSKCFQVLLICSTKHAESSY